MARIRLLPTITTLLATLAVTATPASANFQANQPNTTQGPAQLLNGATNPAEFGIGAGLSWSCEELAKGEWHIQTKFTKVSKGPDGHTKIVQDPTKDGPHQAFSGQFTKCKSSLGTAVTVNSDCELQVVQLTQTKFDGAVKKQCIIKASECTLEIEAGNANAQLFTVEAVNVTEGQSATSNIEGITVVVKGAACAIGGIKNNKTSTLKATVIAHSEKVIP